MDSKLRAKILLVDDQPINITMLRNCLADDYKIFIATNGKNALTIALKEKPDLILLDVKMPEMDGYEVCKKLKAEPATEHIPVIFVTAKTDVDDEAKGLAVGAIDYLTKPVNQDIVKARVRNHILLQERTLELENALEVKEVFLREVNHRVKNNMAIVSTLIKFQENAIADENIKELLRSSRKRIAAMSLVHETLYKSQEYSKIEFTAYMTKLINAITASYQSKPGVTLDIKAEPGIYMSLETATPCGLIINELVLNAYKYAFPYSDTGKVFVELINQDDELTLTISDDGVGLPKDFDFNTAKSLGLKIVNLLSRQIKANIAIDLENGTTFAITFRDLKYKKRI